MMLPSFWIGPDGVRLRGNAAAQLTLAYLVWGPSANAIGLFFVTLAQVAEHTGLAPDEVRASLVTLESLDMAHHDEAAMLAYVPRIAVHQTGVAMRAGSKTTRGLSVELRPYGEHPFVARWWALYRDPLGLADAPPSSVEPQMSLLDEPKSPTPTSPKPAPIRKAGRLPLSVMTVDWRPNDKTLALAPVGLDADLIVEDFRNYWLAQGKRMADWNAAFRNNLTKIGSTPFLMQRFVKVAKAAPERFPRPLPPPPPVGEPVPAPAELRRALEEGLGLRSLDDLNGGNDG